MYINAAIIATTTAIMRIGTVIRHFTQEGNRLMEKIPAIRRGAPLIAAKSVKPMPHPPPAEKSKVFISHL